MTKFDETKSNRKLFIPAIRYNLSDRIWSSTQFLGMRKKVVKNFSRGYIFKKTTVNKKFVNIFKNEAFKRNFLFQIRNINKKDSKNCT